MQLVTKELGTFAAAVAIINSEEGTFGPKFVFVVLFLHIQNNWYTVFVVVAY